MPKSRPHRVPGLGFDREYQQAHSSTFYIPVHHHSYLAGDLGWAALVSPIAHDRSKNRDRGAARIWAAGPARRAHMFLAPPVGRTGAPGLGDLTGDRCWSFLDCLGASDAALRYIFLRWSAARGTLCYLVVG